MKSLIVHEVAIKLVKNSKQLRLSKDVLEWLYHCFGQTVVSGNGYLARVKSGKRCH